MAPVVSQESSRLGWFIVAASSLTKLPQVYNIWQRQSVDGLSLAMYLMESGCQVVTICYHLHARNGFSVYGENVTLGLGNLAILLLWARIKGRLALFGLTSGAVAALAYLLQARPWCVCSGE